MTLRPMPIIVGAPRSGTTLLRFMLDAHPELAIPPETGFLALASSFPQPCGDGTRQTFFESLTTYPPDAPAWRDFGVGTEDFHRALDAIQPFGIDEGYRAFYRLYASRFGKPRWGDKTPVYCMHMPSIAQTLPEAHFIHLIRDGRDVALSLREMWFSPGRQTEVLASYWKDFVTTGRACGATCAHYLEVRFEDLIRDTARVLQRICDFVDLDFSAEMLRYHTRVPERLAEHHERLRQDGTVLVTRAKRLAQQALTTKPPQESRIGSWMEIMSIDEQERFEKIAGLLLSELGYDNLIDSRSPAAVARPRLD